VVKQVCQKQIVFSILQSAPADPFEAVISLYRHFRLFDLQEGGNVISAFSMFPKIKPPIPVSNYARASVLLQSKQRFFMSLTVFLEKDSGNFCVKEVNGGKIGGRQRSEWNNDL